MKSGFQILVFTFYSDASFLCVNSTSESFEIWADLLKNSAEETDRWQAHVRILLPPTL